MFQMTKVQAEEKKGRKKIWQMINIVQRNIQDGIQKI